MGFLVMSLYQMVDTFFVSRFIGETAIGAITVVLPITFLISSFGMAIGVGGSSIISRALGNNEKEKAELTFGNQLRLTLTLVISFVLLGYLFNEPILRLFGANQLILPEAKTYFNILLIGIPFLGWAMMSNNVIRAEGKPKVAMLTLIIPAVVNIILDPILIYYFKMGIAGAAWATTLGYMFSGIYTAWFFLSGKSELGISRKFFKFSGPIVREMSSIGSVTLVRQGSFSVLAIVLNNALNKYGLIEFSDGMNNEGGAHAIAIYGLIRTFTLFVAFPNIGVTQGLMPIVGYNYGSKQFDRLKNSIWLALKWTTLASTVMFVLVYLFSEQLIGFFTEDADLRLNTPRALKIVFLSLPLMGIGFIGAAYFQAIGKTKPAMFLTLARQGLFMIPLVIILPMIFQLDGIWFSIPIGEFLASIVSAAMIYLALFRKDALIKPILRSSKEGA
ncbi:MAG: MATE family efflux transporter [Bacteroidia bacterium]|nr:MATE family efflux transporter [Bacteroidia bacterium]NNJ54533.1 MATE family efflux transporter [Bacteroidia bacterium]